MKIKVFDYKVVNENVFVNGVRTIYKDGVYSNEIMNIRFKKENCFAIVPELMVVPFVINVRFEKGKGAYCV